MTKRESIPGHCIEVKIQGKLYKGSPYFRNGILKFDLGTSTSENDESIGERETGAKVRDGSHKGGEATRAGRDLSWKADAIILFEESRQHHPGWSMNMHAGAIMKKLPPVRADGRPNGYRPVYDLILEHRKLPT